MKLLILYLSTGISCIYGYILWNDIILHTIFMPISGVVFAVILASTIVISLEHIIGDPIEVGIINYSLSSKKNGFFVFWFVCLSVILFGLFLLGSFEVDLF
ncbi:MAG: hypothetical protein LZF64_02935 [Nitrosomonas sp.]|nr:hypothetical protein [Nitrosomonas sp.]UJP00756.1 MAG: hypothetical protein LZF64_02935 [Nitrosomonas sp.]